MRTAEIVSAEAVKWVGTPFAAKMPAVRGVGADCVQLALAIYKRAGVLPDGVQLPEYRLDGGQYTRVSVIVAWMDGPGREWFERCQWPETGGLVAFRVVAVAHHVGVLVSPRAFVHSMRRYGVVESDIFDSTWSRRADGFWRLSA